HAWCVLVPIDAGEGALSALLSKNVVLLGCQLLAPCGVRLFDLLHASIVRPISRGANEPSGRGRENAGPGHWGRRLQGRGRTPLPSGAIRERRPTDEWVGGDEHQQPKRGEQRAQDRWRRRRRVGQLLIAVP